MPTSLPPPDRADVDAFWQRCMDSGAVPAGTPLHDRLGLAFDEQMPTVFERFEVVYAERD